MALELLLLLFLVLYWVRCCLLGRMISAYMYESGKDRFPSNFLRCVYAGQDDDEIESCDSDGTRVAWTRDCRNGRCSAQPPCSLFKSRLMWHVAWDKACGMGQEICEAMGPC